MTSQEINRILVTGGTGKLGRNVVARLRDDGCSVRVLSRHNRKGPNGVEYVVGDLAGNAGIEAAAQGVATIVHCAGTAKGDEQMTRNLVSAARLADVRHVVYISVVGADRVPVNSGIDRLMFGYFAAKAAAENALADSGLGWTTLRATQFHEALVAIARVMSKLPAIPVPAGFRFQPVDAGEVAGRLAELALGAPAGLVPDFAGPKVYPMAELMRSYLAACGKNRPMFSVPVPGGAARAVRGGAVLAPDRAVGSRTWEDYLRDTVSQLPFSHVIHPRSRRDHRPLQERWRG